MHLWRTKKLIEKLRSGTISEKEKAHYYIFTLLAYAGLIELQLWSPTEGPYTKIDFVSFLVFIGTTIFGTLVALRKNIDNQDFISRVTCLTVPIAFKLILITIFFTALAYGVLEYFGKVDESGYSLYEQSTVLAFTIIFQVVFYLRLIKSIELVNIKQ